MTDVEQTVNEIMRLIEANVTATIDPNDNDGEPVVEIESSLRSSILSKLNSTKEEIINNAKTFYACGESFESYLNSLSNKEPKYITENGKTFKVYPSGEKEWVYIDEKGVDYPIDTATGFAMHTKPSNKESEEV